MCDTDRHWKDLSGKKMSQTTSVRCDSVILMLPICYHGVKYLVYQTYKNRTTPVLAMAYASPRIPLPMIALPRLKTDIPNEVFPSNYSQCKTGQERNKC